MRNPPPYPCKKFQISDTGFQIEWEKFVSRAGRLYMQSKAALLGLCFPYGCAGCGELQKYPEVLCSTCVDLLPRIRAPYCSVCGSPMQSAWRVKICPDCRERRPRVTRIRSGFLYEGVIMNLIHEVKFSHRARSLQFFAEQLFSHAIADFPRKLGAIVPVPLHHAREWDRTYNQSALLARELSHLCGIPVQQLLRRRRHTIPQTSLSGQARRRNLQDVFCFRRRSDVPNSVLLIDDVVTTGATLEACAAELRRGGVRRVYCATIARAVLKT